MPKKRTREDFINIANKIHGNKYDYNKSEYVDSDTKLCITCPEHGDFWMTPRNHINMKQGCKFCSHQSYSSNDEEFIKKANKVHGNKYDYSKVNYKNNKEKICIICETHGEFYVRPDNHLHGSGCPKCACERTHVQQKWTTEKFINEAIKINGNQYDYSKVVYNGTTQKVCIICPKHGDFWVTPTNHLRGHGCPVCKQSKMEIDIKQLLIDNNINFEQQKTWEWLVYKSNLKVDFYLPDYNVVIECQGQQHFEPVEFFGGKCAFEDTIKRDSIKKEICEQHGIKVILYSSCKKIFQKNIVRSKKKLLKLIYE